MGNYSHSKYLPAAAGRLIKINGGVGDEDPVDALDFAQRQRRNVSRVEQQAALFEQRLHIDRRKAVAAID